MPKKVTTTPFKTCRLLFKISKILPIISCNLASLFKIKNYKNALKERINNRKYSNNKKQELPLKHP
jgi:hypothetical protein